jgi:hypothetical protein
LKIIRIEPLISQGPIINSECFINALGDIKDAIKLINWPPQSGKFTIFPGKHANGVTPIKKACMIHLEDKGWMPEERLLLGSRLKPGPVDAVLTIPSFGKIAFEWETGNISSSHRALNKMLLGIMNKVLVAGFLAVPSRKLYSYLTDRIGNFSEIEPYFPIWKYFNINGALYIIEVEHDAISKDVPQISKGTDGRALV